MLLEEVLAQARRHEHPARLGVRTEVGLAALTPGRRNIRVELHYSHTKHGEAAYGRGGNRRKHREKRGLLESYILVHKHRTACVKQRERKGEGEGGVLKKLLTKSMQKQGGEEGAEKRGVTNKS